MGSLIPDPRSLAVKETEPWRLDGPLLPIEFARISNGMRLTLVINKDSTPIPVLWAVMIIEDLELAKENLRLREGMTSTKQIGFIDLIHGQKDTFSNAKVIQDIQIWAEKQNLDAVVWTGLRPNFERKLRELYKVENKKLSVENIKWFFQQLTPDEFSSAEDYIKQVPESTMTQLRPQIEGLITKQ